MAYHKILIAHFFIAINEKFEMVTSSFIYIYNNIRILSKKYKHSKEEYLKILNYYIFSGTSS